jgi:hypothetical protein
MHDPNGFKPSPKDTASMPRIFPDNPARRISVSGAKPRTPTAVKAANESDVSGRDRMIGYPAHAQLAMSCLSGHVYPSTLPYAALHHPTLLWMGRWEWPSERVPLNDGDCIAPRLSDPR